MEHQITPILEGKNIKLMINKVKLPEELINKLIQLPEQGMGYQVVRVTLKNGDVLKNRRVVNATYLILKENEEINSDEILAVDLEINN
jgi:hypothetical protein